MRVQVFLVYSAGHRKRRTSKMADDAVENLCQNLDKTTIVKHHYQGIMAFNTVENFVSSSEKDYLPPKFPFELPSFDRSLTFGLEMRKHFLLDLDNWTFLNHGAFGCALKDALETAYKWQCYIEKQPVRFIDREMLPLLAHVNRRLAKFVGSDPRDIVLLPNATAAINTVIKSIDWHPGDTVYFLNTCYYTVKKLFRHLRNEYGKQRQCSVRLSPEDRVHSFRIVVVWRQSRFSEQHFTWTEVVLSDNVKSVDLPDKSNRQNHIT